MTRSEPVFLTSFTGWFQLLFGEFDSFQYIYSARIPLQTKMVPTTFPDESWKLEFTQHYSS